MMTSEETKDFLCTLDFDQLADLSKLLQKRYGGECCTNIEDMVDTLTSYISPEDMYDELSQLLA